MLRVLLLCLLLPAGAMAALASDGQAAGREAVTAGPTAEAPVVLVLGDSLSAAYGLPLDKGWVSLLQSRIAARGLPHRVVNAAISGDTVAGGLSRLPALLSEQRPAVVVIELGANDGLRGFAPAAIRDNLIRLVEAAQEAGAEVAVAGVRLPPNYGSAYTERFQQLYAAVAEQTGAVLIPRLLADVAEEPSLMQDDGLHPTAAAQPRILDNVWPVLMPLLEQTRG
jgi:acyl-CoA thioesterase-1